MEERLSELRIALALVWSELHCFGSSALFIFDIA